MCMSECLCGRVGGWVASFCMYALVYIIGACSPSRSRTQHALRKANTHKAQTRRASHRLKSAPSLAKS